MLGAWGNTIKELSLVHPGAFLVDVDAAIAEGLVVDRLCVFGDAPAEGVVLVFILNQHDISAVNRAEDTATASVGIQHMHLRRRLLQGPKAAFLAASSQCISL